MNPRLSKQGDSVKTVTKFGKSYRIFPISMPNINYVGIKYFQLALSSKALLFKSWI